MCSFIETRWQVKILQIELIQFIMVMVFQNNSYIQTKKTIKMEIIMEKRERERMVFVCVYTDNDTDSRTRPKLIWKLNFNNYLINTFAFEQNATNQLIFNKSR